MGIKFRVNDWYIIGIGIMSFVKSLMGGCATRKLLVNVSKTEVK